ncbi:MAG: response regulator transcription factor [Lentisphaerae bacterium]|nr:response regulator transcription factor [Lentisphaerota bacterium]
MSRVRILVAEDDPPIRRGLVDALGGEGYEVEAVADGGAALRAFAPGRFALLLLDIMMPERSGYDVCRAVRATDTATPIILLTAKGEEIDKVVGLELGADDYITKPFGVRELLARIAAVLRRSRAVAPATAAPPPTDSPRTLRFGAAEIDRRTFRGRLGRRTFEVTARELKLIEAFHARPDEVLSRDVLLNEVWGVDYFGTTRTLDQHIAQLRKKIEASPAEPRTILTVHGVGYRYMPE